jgi:hypothetical protein
VKKIICEVNFKKLLDKNEGRCNNVSVKKKNPRYIAGAFERIFADHKLCCIYIWLRLAGSQSKHLESGALLFEFFAPNLPEIDPYRIYFKIIYFLVSLAQWEIGWLKAQKVITKT